MKEKRIEEEMKEWRANFDFMMSGETVVMRAMKINESSDERRFRSQNVIRWLLQELRFDVNEQTWNGDTALHCAVYYNEVELARLFLDLGAQQLKNNQDKTPLEWAKECAIWKSEEMINLLESHFHSC